MTILSLVTVPDRVRAAYDFIDDFAGVENNQAFLGIGQCAPWSGNDTIVPQPIETTDYINNTWRNLVALKIINASEASIVVRRVDWANNTVYNAYSNSTQMFTYTNATNANGVCNVTNSAVVNGVGTTFFLDFANNNILQLQGDGLTIFPQQREIINVVSNTQLIVNLAFTGNIVSNTPQNLVNNFPFFAQNFYVRNTLDQVFVCLYNANNAPSTIMPAISIGGQLPTDQYMLTSDGYKWKYLYTISGGLKQQFFTADWMPVVTDSFVLNSAISGRLDIINIVNPGTNYNNSSASFSAPTLTVSGDGTGANLTASVSNTGSITGINILNAGQNYTNASIMVLPSPNSGNANIQAVIGPTGGWGSNAALELGATTVMFSINLTGTENGTIPTQDDLNNLFQYRQISLIFNPVLSNNHQIANSTNYDMTTTLVVSVNTAFAMNDIVFQSPNGAYSSATFIGNVVYFDNANNFVHLNNVSGQYVPQTTIYGTKNPNSAPYASVTSFGLIAPLIQSFNGQILYVENRNAIQRNPNQTENIKFIISF